MSDDSGSISRRGLLGGFALATATTLAATAKEAGAAKPRAPAIGRNLPDVAVVGAGAFGAWTALCLRERGAKVTLLDS